MSVTGSHTQPFKTPRESFWLIFFGLLVLGAISLVAVNQDPEVYSISNRIWGFDNWRYYAWPLKLSVALLFICFLLPAISHKVRARLHPRFLNRFPVKFNKQVLYAIGFAILFYLLQVKYYFLGDFNIRMMQCMSGDYVNTEYATMWTLHHLALIVSKFGMSTEQFFKLYSVAMGFAFVLLAIKMSIALSEQSLRRWLIFFTIVCTSALLLYCGYVEIYATPAVLLLWFMYASVCYLNGASNYLYPLIVWLLALSSHLIAVAALPALLSLLYFKSVVNLHFFRKLSDFRKTSLLIIITLVGTALIYMKGHPFLMVLKAPVDVPTRMTLFSAAHIWEFLNGQILCSGFSLVVIIYLLIYALIKTISIRKATVFFLLLSVGFLLLTFVSDLQRGSGDWDIMSFTAVPLNLSALFLVLDVYKHSAKTAQYIACILLVINFTNAVLWLHIHHTDRSIQKITNMLSTDPASYYDARIPGTIQLALCFQNNKLYAEQEKIALKICNASKGEDVAGCAIYLQRLVETQRTEEARQFAEDLLNNRTPAIYEAYLFLLPYFEKADNNEKILFYLNKMFDAFLDRPYAFLYSPNFKKETLIGLFKTLYQYGGNNMNQQRRETILQTIAQVENYRIEKK